MSEKSVEDIFASAAKDGAQKCVAPQPFVPPLLLNAGVHVEIISASSDLQAIHAIKQILDGLWFTKTVKVGQGTVHDIYQKRTMQSLSRAERCMVLTYLLHSYEHERDDEQS